MRLAAAADATLGCQTDDVLARSRHGSPIAPQRAELGLGGDVRVPLVADYGLDRLRAIDPRATIASGSTVPAVAIAGRRGQAARGT